jgi:hypothetical protein
LRAHFVLLLAISAALGAASCGPIQKRNLLGKWKGVSMTEEGDSLAIDPTLIRFEFMPKGKYAYQGTLNYAEAGDFYLDAFLLYTEDTTREDSREKAVEVQLLDKDSLHLRMIEKGKERILKMARDK